MSDEINRAHARAALEWLLPRIQLKNWPWKIELRIAHRLDGEVLAIHETRPDRDTGEESVLGGMGYGEPPPRHTPDGQSVHGYDRAILDWVYHQLQRHVLHELAEAFHVDGVRAHDPHKNEERDLAILLEEAPIFGQYAEKASLGHDVLPLSMLPPPPGGTFLTSEQIAELAHQRAELEKQMDAVQERAEEAERLGIFAKFGRASKPEDE